MRLFATMVVYTGAPDYLNTLRGVEHRALIGRNYFQNLMMIQRSRCLQNLVAYEKDFLVSDRRWPDLPFGVSCSTALGNIEGRRMG